MTVSGDWDWELAQALSELSICSNYSATNFDGSNIFLLMTFNKESKHLYQLSKVNRFY